MHASRSVKGYLRYLVACGLAMASSAVTAQAPDYATAEAQYRAMLSRPSLNRRIEGRRLLAATGDARAFAILSKDYLGPEEPQDIVRSLLVTVLADFFPSKPPPYAAWQQWRTSQVGAPHAWLWYRSLRIEGAADAHLWRTVFAEKLPIELRAVVLAAAAAQTGGVALDTDTLGLIMDAAAKVGTKSYERSLMLEGLVGLFEAPTDALGNSQRAVLRSLVYAMAEPATSARSKVVLARTLARVLDRFNFGPDAASWIELLADAPTEQAESVYAMKRLGAKPGFFGITEHGRCIAYVIDASDSMLAPLTQKERGELQPLTGAGATKADPGAPTDAARAARAIDWDKVKTRFDGARELLKLALRDLVPDQQFTVVLFGDKAEHLVATPRLVAASAKHVEAACKEMDAIIAGPVKANRPHGTLRGATNLHAGLACAFRVGDAKPSKPAASGKKKVEPPRTETRLDERGVDTIYLLSDGAPSADDFNGEDTNDGTDVSDPETRATKLHAGPVIYPGPFAWEPFLLTDVQRMNLLQRCAIHTVGIGEANFTFLKELSAVGHGATVQIGKQ